ncbi:MAG: SDR family NAD(P)-dependent oxidoreductase [Candidatus Gracilibacteria bacterium]|nr:SDR family NAD(P)-dependent oxidoreductase [Candidatus Gracilibacteria bacterium]
MQKILITGTTSGIGNFLATNLKDNYEIIGVGRGKNNIEGIDFFCGDLKEEYFLNNISQNISKIDYLIINAGVGYFDKFEKINLKEHKEILNINLISPIILTSLLLDKINCGIIFIGSVSSKKSAKFGASYSASKFGLRGFAMNLKNELKGLNIYLINPKIVKTNFHKNSKIEIVGKYEETKIEIILSTIKNIIEKKENRFEIDL